MMDAQDWDERYAASELVWSAGPNQFVESICRDLPPGRMIDLAAGEGRNALWFAEHGWEATAVDYSGVAAAKAQELAAHRGVELATVVEDLVTYKPQEGGYDLVLVAYLHLGCEERTKILENAAAGVAPGGLLLLLGHDATNLESGYGGPQSVEVLTSPDEVVAILGDDCEIVRAEVIDRIVDTENGARVAKDTLVLAHR